MGIFRSRWFMAAALLALLTACAAPQKLALDTQKRQSIKHVALVQIPEPTTYGMDPGAMPGGAALYVFGALGGAILGGIEASRHEAATKQFMSTLEPTPPALGKLMADQLEAGLLAKGYTVTRVAMPPKMPDGKEYDFSKLGVEHDVVLLTELGAGYAVEGKTVGPRVRLVASLHARGSKEKLFSDGYVYGNAKWGEMVWIERDPRFALPSMEAVYGSPAIAVEGMREGARKLTERLVADL